MARIGHGFISSACCNIVLDWNMDGTDGTDERRFLLVQIEKSEKISGGERHLRHLSAILQCLIRTLMTATGAARMEPMNTDVLLFEIEYQRKSALPIGISVKCVPIEGLTSCFSY